MPRIPRDLSGVELCRLLGFVGYRVTRQRGSHIRLEADHQKGIHRLTVPDHGSIKIGTLNNILADVADKLEIAKSELVERLFDK